MLFEEQQVRHHDVGVPDRVLRAVKRARVLGPFGGGEDFDGKPREILGKRGETRAAGPAECASSVRITTR